MKLKPKTVRRFLLLGGVAVIAGAAVVTFVYVRGWQSERTSLRLREAGMAAMTGGDDVGVIDNLGPYLKSLGSGTGDAEALLAYARARAAVEDPDGSHTLRAAQVMAEYLRLRKDDRGVAVELLKLYNKAGFFAEARDLASRLRPAALAQADASDAVVLREEVGALLALRARDEELVAVLSRLLELTPLDVDSGLALDQALRRGGKSAEADARLAGLIAAHPEDPRPRLIRLVGGVDLAREAEVATIVPALSALTGLHEVTGQRERDASFPDQSYAMRAAALFDLAGKFDHATSVLCESARRVNDPVLRTYFARRAWQGGRALEVAQALEGLSSGDKANPGELLGFRALALKQLGRNEEADALAAALLARGYDYRARAFGAMTRWYLPRAGADLAAGVKELQRAAKDLPREPVLAVILGDTLAGLGRTDEAASQWTSATESPLAIGWAAPWIRLARVNLSMGALADAQEAADQSIFTAPRSVEAGMVKFTVTAARAMQSESPAPDWQPMLRFAESALATLQSLEDKEIARELADELVAGRTLLLARLGRREDASAFAREWLARPDGLSRAGLERLAEVSEAVGLGVEREALEKAGGDAPSTAALMARGLLKQGRGAASIVPLREGEAKATGPAKSEWGMAVAAHLDLMGDEKAMRAWIELADANPEHTELQRRAIRSASAGRDAEFVERAAERIARASGGDATPTALVRLARARAMLAGEPGARQRENAVAMLRAVINQWPHMLEAHLLLAEAMLLDAPEKGLRPNLDAGVEHLRAAAGCSPSPAPIELRLAEVLQQGQSFDRAREELRRIARENPGNAAVRGRCAELLIAQGEEDMALAIVDGLVRGAGASARSELRVSYAELLTHAGRDAEALAQLRLVAATEKPDAELLPVLAGMFARLGDSAGAAAAMGRLDAITLAPGQKELLQGRAEELQGRLDEAAGRYRLATEKDKALVAAWRGLVQALLKNGRPEEAMSAVRESVKALPEHPEIRVLEQQVLVSTRGVAGLGALADALARDPARAEEARIVRSIQALAESHRLEDPDALADLASKHSESLAVQNLVVRQLLSLNPPQGAIAARLAQRAMLRFGSTPEPARLATEAYARMGEWGPALSAARAWRERDPAGRAQADFAIAQANLALGHGDLAFPVLQTLLRDALANPQTPYSLGVIDQYLRAALATDRHDEAARVLGPVLESHPIVRTAPWLSAASEAGKESVAQAWVDRAAKLCGDSVEEKASLASAYTTLAGRFAGLRRANVDAALAILRPLCSDPKNTHPSVLELLGMTLQTAMDLPGAERAYREAIAIEPGRVSSLVNLAWLKNSMAGGRAEALELAEKAYALSAGVDPAVNAALGSILIDRAEELAKEGEPEKAKELAKRGATIFADVSKRRPNDVEPVVQLAHATGLAEDFEGSASAYTKALGFPGVELRRRAGFQNNAAYALFRSGRERHELLRAETLAREAIRVDESPSTLGTLGSVLAALGQRKDAITTFRRSLRLDPARPEAILGLAEILASGTPEEREEASQLIRPLLETPGLTGRLSESQISALAKLKSQLARP